MFKSLVGLLGGALVGFIACGTSLCFYALDLGASRVYREAARAGHGYYHMDPETGETEFVWHPTEVRLKRLAQ